MEPKLISTSIDPTAPEFTLVSVAGGNNDKTEIRLGRVRTEQLYNWLNTNAQLHVAELPQPMRRAG